jgi:hypothetical protein
MLLERLGLLAATALALAPVAALAQGPGAGITIAQPGSVENLAGQGILYFVGGRTKDDAMRTSNDFNPYQIDGDDLLFSLGAFFVTTTYDGEPVDEGELSIFPQFVTPLEAHIPTAATPAIIPFALMQQGICHAGYVAGFPVPDTIFDVDLSGQICHAAIVEEVVYAAYAAASPETGPVSVPSGEPAVEPQEQPAPATTTFDPAMPTPLDLDVIVWAAYNAAYAVAVSGSDYLFIRDGDFATVRAAILAELAKEGYAGVVIAGEPAASVGEAFACGAPGATELKVAFVAGNAGVVLVATSGRLRSSYRYDPSVTYDLDIQTARECQSSGPGRLPAVNVP